MTDATKERKRTAVLAMAELAPYQEKDGEEYMNEEQRASHSNVFLKLGVHSYAKKLTVRLVT